MTITLAEIKDQCRQRADMEDSTFVQDAELTSYINNSIAELHDLLIAAYNEDYFLEEVQFSATSSLTYDLPNGTNYSAAPKFYKLRGVDVKRGSGSDWATVKRFNFNRRNEDEIGTVLSAFGLPYLSYRLTGSKIRFNRTPDSGLTFRLFYYPAATVLVDDADEYDDINGFIEYVITDVVIKMLTKEESDAQVFMVQKDTLRKRIEAMAKDRDVNEPESVTDIYAEETEKVLIGKY